MTTPEFSRASVGYVPLPIEDMPRIGSGKFDLSKALAGHPLVVDLPDGSSCMARKFRLRKSASAFRKYEAQLQLGGQWHWKSITDTAVPDALTILALPMLRLDLISAWRGKFDLQAALDGHPLVTRKGEVVTLQDYTPGSRFCLTANVRGLGRAFTARGRARMQGKAKDDLFLDLRAKWELDHPEKGERDE